MRAKTRVLIADDSRTVRNVLAAMFGEDKAIEVIGQASDGVEAVALAKKLKPDVITMDILMPRLDGLAAIEQIMVAAPSRILVVSSVSEVEQLDLSSHAIAAGALELMGKPVNTSPSDLRGWGERVCNAVKLMGSVPIIARKKAAPPSAIRLPEVDSRRSTTSRWCPRREDLPPWRRCWAGCRGTSHSRC